MPDQTAETGGVPIDPIEPTQINDNLVAVPLAPTVWDDLADDQHAVTRDGEVWQRRGGLWHADPWYQREDSEQIIAVCADPDSWAHGSGWPRAMVEDTYGPLTPITLPGASRFPHDDDRCRQWSIDADGFTQVCRALGRIAVAAGLPDGLGADEAADLIIQRLSGGAS